MATRLSSEIAPVVVWVPPSEEGEYLRRAMQGSWDAVNAMVDQLERQKREIAQLKLALGVTQIRGCGRALIVV